MNESLKESLKEYFFGSYQEIPRSEEGKAENSKMYDALNSLGLSWEDFDKLEEAITKASEALELQGFLRGYKYCLTMLGLASEG